MLKNVNFLKVKVAKIFETTRWHCKPFATALSFKRNVEVEYTIRQLHSVALINN